MNINDIIQCLDNYMINNGLTSIDAPKANAVLARNGLLGDSWQRPGKPLRDLLRAGRLPHAYQQGRTWKIPISGNTTGSVNVHRESLASQPVLTGNDNDSTIMKFGSVEDMIKAGFKGFVPVFQLKSAGIWTEGDRQADADLDRQGVYLVVRVDMSDPEFVSEGSGGHFKGRNPDVPVSELAANWVDDTCVLYIGKAGGKTSHATLRKRIGQYIRFGEGKPVGHWGGRYIWQLKDCDNLLFCWKASEDAEILESELIAGFKSQYGGRRPFANLRD